jgi:hypothetical protein
LWQGAVAGANGFVPHFYPWFWMERYRTGDDTSPAQPADELEREVIEAAAAVGVVLTVAQLRWWRARRSSLGARKVMQEFPHDPRRCFLLSGESYFDLAALDRLDAATQPHMGQRALDAAMVRGGPAQEYVRRVAELVRTVNRGGVPLLRVWQVPAPGGSYVVSCDCAGGGANGDWLVAQVWHRTKREHVATLRVRISPPEFARLAWMLALAYGGALVCVERNGHGGTVLHVLEQECQYPHLWRDAKGALGWFTGPHNRTPSVDDFADALLRDELVSRDATLAGECRTFVHKANGRIEHDRGCNDDTVMAAVIAWAVLNGPRAPVRGPRAGLVPLAAP